MSSDSITTVATMNTSSASSDIIETDKTEKNVVLTSNDGETFIISVNTAKLSNYWKTHIENHGDDEEDIMIPVFLDTVTLAQVVGFMKHHAEVEPMTEVIRPQTEKDIARLVQPFYVEFINQFASHENLLLWLFFGSITILEIKPLMDLCCIYAVGLIKNESECAKVRDLWGLPDNLTPEEKIQKRKDNEWMDGC